MINAQESPVSLGERVCYDAPFTDDPSTENLSIASLRKHFDAFYDDYIAEQQKKPSAWFGASFETIEENRARAHYLLALLSCGFETSLQCEATAAKRSIEVDRFDFRLENGQPVVCITEFKELRGHLGTMLQALTKHVPKKIISFTQLVTQLSQLAKSPLETDCDDFKGLMDGFYLGIGFSGGAPLPHRLAVAIPAGYKLQDDNPLDQLLLRYVLSLFDGARFIFNFSISGLNFDGLYLTKVFNRLVENTMNEHHGLGSE